MSAISNPDVNDSESYSVMIFSVGKNPTDISKSPYEPKTPTTPQEVLSESEDADKSEGKSEEVSKEKSEEKSKKEYNPSPFEKWFDSEESKKIPFNQYHRETSDGPMSLTFNGLGPDGKEMYDAFMKNPMVAAHMLEFYAIDAECGLLKDMYFYEDTVCVMIEGIPGSTVPGSKSNDYQKYASQRNFRAYSICAEQDQHFQIIDLNKSVNERNQRILRSVVAKRTFLSECFGKHELFFSEDGVIDFDEFVVDYSAFSNIPKRHIENQLLLNRDTLGVEISGFDDVLEFIDDDGMIARRKNRSELMPEYMVVGSTNETHLAQIMESIRFALNALEIECVTVDVS
jgi:hypothetical protein